MIGFVAILILNTMFAKRIIQIIAWTGRQEMKTNNIYNLLNVEPYETFTYQGCVYLLMVNGIRMRSTDGTYWIPIDADILIDMINHPSEIEHSTNEPYSADCGKWIPSSTPPEREGRYLCLLKSGSCYDCEVLSYNPKRNSFIEIERGGALVDCECVIGWMELPEPMEEQE